jgi:hypothetical protein
MLDATRDSFVATITSAADLNASTVAKGWKVPSSQQVACGAVSAMG